MYNDENNQYNPRPRFDPKTGERIHYDDENTTETTQAESSEYRYSAGNIPFEQENNNTSLLSAEQYIPAGYNLSAGRRRAGQYESAEWKAEEKEG